MNVRQMLEEIPKRYPDATLQTEGWSGPKYYFLVTFSSGWGVGAGYDYNHYADTKVYQLSNPPDSTTVEIAMFQPNGKWYVVEGMDTSESYDGSPHGYLAWQNSEKLFEILDYISKMEGSL